MKIYYDYDKDGRRCFELCTLQEWKGVFEPKIGSTFCTERCPKRGGLPGSDRAGNYVLCEEKDES